MIKLIEQLTQLNITLQLVDGKLRIQAPTGALTDELKAQLREHKDALIESLEQSQAQQHRAEKEIKPISRDEELPLSFAQQRMWMLSQIEADSSAYHISAAFSLQGELDLRAFQCSVDALVHRHEILRTVYHAPNHDSQQPEQSIQASKAINIVSYDGRVAGDSEEAIDPSVKEWFEVQASKPFDLSCDSVLRVQLVSLNSHRHLMQLVIHHIAVDAWAMDIISQEFGALYTFALEMPEADAKTLSEQLPSQALQYADFAKWQRQFLESDDLQSQIKYWHDSLGDEQPILTLPTKIIRNSSHKRVSGRKQFCLNETLSADLHALSDAEEGRRLTPYVVLLATLQKLLRDYSGQQDVRVGVPTANRNKPQIQSMVGCFVNTLVMKADFDATQTVSDYLYQCQQRSLEAQENQDVPFEMLVNDLVETRDVNSTPLFQVMFNYLHSEPTKKSGLDQLSFEPIELKPQAIKFDLTLTVQAQLTTDSLLNINCVFDYDAALYSAEFIDRFVTQYQTLLARLVDANKNNAELPLDQINGLSDQQIEQQLVTFNDTFIDHSDGSELDVCFAYQFERVVVQSTDRTALQFGSSSMSYGELNERANQLADYLIKEHSVGPEVLVGLCVERSFEMVIGIVAILKAGGAYVPLDPQYPQARLAYILEDTNVDVVLTQSYLNQRITLFGDKAVCLDAPDFLNSLTTYNKNNRASSDVGVASDNLAYVIYTSGSTGQPKGVMIDHMALHNRIDWMHRTYGCDESDVVMQKTPFSFDVSVWEFIWTLSKGACLVLAKPEGHKDPQYLSALIRETGVTKMHFVPSMLAVMLAHDGFAKCHSLQQVFCSGEALSRGHVDALYESYDWIELHNLYGPTEAAIDVSFWDCRKSIGIDSGIPIGQPIQNIQLHVLDASLNLLPLGAVGELHIAGIGLARGYLNRDDLTQEKFVHNPYSNEEGARLYKTGDLARWNENGVIEYLGRTDDQVKVRGFRIELGEVEAAIIELNEVHEAVVVARDEPKRLVAYIVSANSSLSEMTLLDNVKQSLSINLPSHMVPSLIMQLDALPLTTNGKVNRKALPEPSANSSSEYQAPVTPTEILLSEIWQEVLSIDRVGVNDNFFELGGHSLLVIRVISLLQGNGVNANVRDLFTSPCLFDLALVLDSTSSKAPVFRAPERAIPEAAEVIKPAMLPLLELTQQEINSLVSVVPGGAANILDIYPLAGLQEGIYFHHLMSRDTDPYVLSNLLQVSSRQHLDKLIDALQFIINRHDVLRTLVVSDDLPHAVQVVCKNVELPVVWLELDGDIESQMQDKCESGHWLDITKAPLLCLNVAQDGDRFHVLMQYHHLISDHEGLAIIQRELMAYFSDAAHSLPKPVPYREFVAHAQHQLKHSESDEFFKGMLGDIDEPVLPFGLLNTNNDGSRLID